MKKVTIVTSTEHESLLLDQLGKARLISFKTIPPSEYQGFEETFIERVDFSALYKELDNNYKTLIRLEPSLQVMPQTPDDYELKELAKEPEKMTQKIIKEVVEMRLIIEKKKLPIENAEEQRDLEIEKLKKELEENKAQLQAAYRKKWEAAEKQIKQLNQTLYSLKTNAKSLKVLNPHELKNCSAAGVAKTEVIKEIEEFLKSRSKGGFKSYEISDTESLLFFFGMDEDRNLIEFLFLVYEVVDVFDTFKTGDLLLVLDPKRMESRIKEYETLIAEKEKELGIEQKLEKSGKEIEAEIARLDDKYEKLIIDAEEKYSALVEEKKKQYVSEVSAFKQDWLKRLAEIRYYQTYLKKYSRNMSTLRNKVLCIMQGWVPDNKIREIENILNSVGKDLGEKPYYKVESPDHSDRHIPTPAMELKPGFLQPAWILTYLRGWPKFGEFNPGYLSIIIFCIQFGLMYGDVGQGIVLLVLGIILSKKFNQGMLYRLGGLLIPMGFAAAVFGVFYDSVFLIEGSLERTFHLSPILPNPMEHPTTMMKLIFLIAAIEVIIGLGISIFNHIKEGNVIEILGEHGLGLILYITGLYLTAMYYISIGMNFMGALANWTFLLVIGGLVLSLITPIIQNIHRGDGFQMIAVSEGIGGLMMTFVEGLANLFSFLRIVAFAIAHASLAVAAHSLTLALGSQMTLPIFIIMNLIALTFEFVSSGVQSLRLLYYEFMGKFYKGDGLRWKPFSLPCNQE